MGKIIGKLEEGLGNFNNKVLAGCVALQCSGLGDVVCYAEDNVDVVEVANPYLVAGVGIGAMSLGYMAAQDKIFGENTSAYALAIFTTGFLVGTYCFM